MRRTDGRRRLALSIFVVLSVAATTAGGLQVAFGDGAAVLSTAGRSVGESSPARIVGEGSNVSEIEPALAASGISVANIANVAQPNAAQTLSDEPAVQQAASRDDAVGAAPIATPAGQSNAPSGNTAADNSGTSPATASAETVDGPSEASADTAVPTTQTSTTQAPTTAAPTTPTTQAPIDRTAPVVDPGTRFADDSPTTTTTTVAPPTVLSTVSISTSGSDSNSGVSGSPVATLERALELVTPGGTIQFEAGTYGPLRVVGVSNVRLVGGGGVVFRGTSYSEQAGILIENSRDVELSGMTVNRALWGIYVSNSTNIGLRTNQVSDIGQEAIRIKDGSSNVVIDGNVISDTGRRSSDANGEGIYIGTGSPGGVDHVSNVTISRNRISRTTDEAIDIKTPSTNIVIRENTISDIVTQTTGAVVVHVNSNSSADPNITIERNVVRNVRRNSAHRDGNCIVTHVTTRIVNNVLHNCEHRGIHLAGNSGHATVLHNTLINPGSIGAIVSDGMNVTSQNNLGASGAENREADSSLFPSSGQGNYRLAASALDRFDDAPSVGVSNDLTGASRSGSGSITFGAVE